MLSKTHAMTLKVERFTPDRGFPLSTSGLTLTVLPRIACDPIVNQAGVNSPRCSFTQPSIRLPVRAGASSANAKFDVAFTWQFASGSGGFDIASFKVYTNTYAYKVNGSERPAGLDALAIASESSDGRMVAPEIRCDRNEVTSGKSGCVLPRAAPVYVLSRTDSTLSEAAQHIYSAQRALSPGRTMLSPGRFSLKQGTRAVMADRGEPQYQPLQREKDEATKRRNRDAACTKATALFNTRPYQGSASCPVRKTAGCECDEFPFASTANGGAFSPDSTSVKSVLGTHNAAAGGGRLTTFYGSERVLSQQAAFDPFWVEIK